MRSAVVMGWLLVAATGCDLVLGLEREPLLCVDDDFAAETFDPALWRMIEPANREIPVVLANGAVEVAFPAGITGANGLETREAFDMTNVAVSVEVLDVPRDPNAELGLYLLSENPDEYYLLNFYDPYLLVRVRSQGVNDEHVVSYDPVADRFWRLAHDRGLSLMRYETSADGIEWVIRSEEDAVVPVTAATVKLQSDAFLGGPAQQQAAVLDNFSMSGGSCGP